MIVSRAVSAAPTGIDKISISPHAWVVQVECCNADRAEEKCDLDSIYIAIGQKDKNLPRFIGYYDPKNRSGNVRAPALRILEAYTHTRSDVFLISSATFIGPFNSRAEVPKLDEWIGKRNYIGIIRQVEEYVGHLDSEERIIESPKKVSGKVTMVSYGNMVGGFEVVTDSKEEFLFDGLSPVDVEQLQKGQRVTVEYRNIVTKRGGKIVSTAMDMLSMTPEKGSSSAPQQ